MRTIITDIFKFNWDSIIKNTIPNLTNYIMLRVLLSLLLVFILSTQYVTAQSKFNFERAKTVKTNLKDDYNYGLFEANKKFLVWFEFYTGTLHIYDLLTKSLEKMKISKGRGPGEYIAISDLALIDDKVFLLDPNNLKLIKISSSKEEKYDISISSSTPMTFAKYRDGLVMMEINKPNDFFYLYDMENDEYSSFNLEELNLLKEFKNGFYRYGYQAISEKYLIHLTRYMPKVYIFDMDKLRFTKKIQFDESDIESGKTQEKDGVKVTLPPAKVDILTEDVAYLPVRPNSIFILAKGKSDNRDYNLNKLYEYNFIKEKFVATHDLGVKATEITVNEDYLFVYSEEEGKIFKYKIIKSTTNE